MAGVYEEINSDFQKLLKNGNIDPKPLLVCSGGTSSRCTANNHWTLDLRKNYQQVEFVLKLQLFFLHGKHIFLQFKFV